jgi:hypothetical protein
MLTGQQRYIRTISRALVGLVCISSVLWIKFSFDFSRAEDRQTLGRALGLLAYVKANSEESTSGTLDLDGDKEVLRLNGLGCSHQLELAKRNSTRVWHYLIAPKTVDSDGPLVTIRESNEVEEYWTGSVSVITECDSTILKADDR